MLTKLKKPNNQGFTIIEVMIVLAIAGLILLIVFLAVPALQRAQRNSGRKSDAGHINTAVNDFVSNNNGTLPGGTTGATWAADCGTILNDAGNLTQYTSGNSFACSASALANGTLNKFDEEYGDTTAPSGIKGQGMVLDEDAQCPTSGSTPVAATSPTQAALLYTVEVNGGGNWTWDCVESQ